MHKGLDLTFLCRSLSGERIDKGIKAVRKLCQNFYMNLYWESESLISSFYHMTTAGFVPSEFVGEALCTFCLVNLDLVGKLMPINVHACEKSWC